MKEKFDKLKQYLRELDKQGLCLAFSGGIDSCALLYLCKDLNVIAVTFKSIFQTEQEINEAKEFCNFYGIKQKIIEYYPLENNIIRNNPKDRCYHCKKLIFSELKRYAGNKIIIDGTNADDTKTYRPGLKALKELGIYSPFADFGITKKEIIDFSKEESIKNYAKPSSPCIATRFPYNTLLNEELIEKKKKGEEIIKNFGFTNCRFRIHDNIARIEINQEEIEKFIRYRKDILNKLKVLDIKYITLDLECLRNGSMDI